MTARIWIVAALALLGSAPLVHAQEDWGDQRREYMHRLREACDDGDERACWRLDQMRRAWRERHEWQERHEWRERNEENRRW
jgi:hypothetical protein